MAPDPLLEFLEARTAEAQACAEAMEHYTVYDETYLSCPATRTEPFGDLPWGEKDCDCGLAARKARALRDVEAKRVIVAEYEAVAAAPPADDCDRALLASLRAIIMALAAIDSDHPDYRAEWKP